MISNEKKGKKNRQYIMKDSQSRYDGVKETPIRVVKEQGKK